MTTISSLQSLTLDLPPSCIQFCPSHPDLFVVGTYFLHGKEHGNNVNDESTGSSETSKQTRTGSLILFRLDHENNFITQLSTTRTDYAVLDIQWCPHEPDLLAAAGSTGVITFYQLDEDGPGLVLSHVQPICDPETLVLSLTWHPTQEKELGLTLSDGRVCTLSSTREAENAMHLSEIHSHALEAWICSFTSNQQLLSGGDDMLLQCSTLANNNIPWQDRKLHNAGITYILPLPHSETLILTGSYDDHIRLLSLPPIGRRQCLAELDLGGGVWRLKILSSSHPALSHPTISYILLASCMHAGTRILRLTSHHHREEDRQVWTFSILGKFEEHESMNYGSDSPPRSSASVPIVSTSFYDRKMCLWRFAE